MGIMGDSTGRAQGADIAAFRKLRREMDVVVERMLERARNAQEKDREAGERVLREAEEIGRAGQAYQGRLLLLLAQAQRLGAVPGGLDAWIATHLDVTRGTATGIMKQAKAVGTVPALAAPLASGKVGPGTISALARTARAVRHEDAQTRADALDQTLKVAREQGADHAKRHVRVLEESLAPGKAGQDLAKARERSFLRIVPTGSGMCRIEALLDPVRATVVRASIDGCVAAFLRARQFDGVELVAEDVLSTEQLRAEALVRLAETFTRADAATRALAFSPPTLYTAPLDPQQDAGLAESVYGDLVPREVLPPPGTPGARLLEHDAQGQPVRLDGEGLDQSPMARLASAAQRIALAWRDRQCTYPGCDRPPPFALHAHHRVPFRRQGSTTLANLTLLCAPHHTLTHQEED